VVLKSDLAKLKPLARRMLHTSDPEKLQALLAKLNG
jgi:hypothetical protein